MGNKANIICNNQCNNQQNKPKPQSAKCNSNNLNKINKKHDKFIIKLANLHNQNIITDLSLFDAKRVIFISLIGIYETYLNCPSFLLYTSLFIVPLKEIWIKNSKKYLQQIYFKLFGSFNINASFDSKMIEFIKLLQWKQSQGLLFCMLDEYEYTDQDPDPDIDLNHLICPFWYNLSSSLVELYDPITQDNYSPIKFDIHFWRSTNIYHDNVKVSEILTELYFKTGNYKFIRELLHQSNPKSFNIITRYHKYCSNNTNKMKKVSTITLRNMYNTKYNNNNNDDDKDEWYISEDYDPVP